MIPKKDVTVRLTPELRLEQALKEAGVENPETVRKLDISGEITDADFKYFYENMADTLQELDMGAALVDEGSFNYYMTDEMKNLTSIIIPKLITDIDQDVFVVLTNVNFVTIPGRFLSPLAGFLSEDDFDD
jgi:hypothetical protein